MVFEVPLPILPDGRAYVSDFMLVEYPHLYAMVKRRGWERDFRACIWVVPEGASDCASSA